MIKSIGYKTQQKDVYGKAVYIAYDHNVIYSGLSSRRLSATAVHRAEEIMEAISMEEGRQDLQFYDLVTNKTFSFKRAGHFFFYQIQSPGRLDKRNSFQWEHLPCPDHVKRVFSHYIGGNHMRQMVDPFQSYSEFVAELSLDSSPVVYENLFSGTNVAARKREDSALPGWIDFEIVNDPIFGRDIFHCDNASNILDKPNTVLCEQYIDDVLDHAEMHFQYHQSYVELRRLGN